MYLIKMACFTTGHDDTKQTKKCRHTGTHSTTREKRHRVGQVQHTSSCPMYTRDPCNQRHPNHPSAPAHTHGYVGAPSLPLTFYITTHDSSASPSASPSSSWSSAGTGRDCNRRNMPTMAAWSGAARSVVMWRVSSAKAYLMNT